MDGVLNTLCVRFRPWFLHDFDKINLKKKNMNKKSGETWFFGAFEVSKVAGDGPYMGDGFSTWILVGSIRFNPLIWFVSCQGWFNYHNITHTNGSTRRWTFTCVEWSTHSSVLLGLVKQWTWYSIVYVYDLVDLDMSVYLICLFSCFPWMNTNFGHSNYFLPFLPLPNKNRGA